MIAQTDKKSINEKVDLTKGKQSRMPNKVSKQ